MKHLRVWHLWTYVKGRQCVAIVAAYSRAQAGRLLGHNDRVMREYASETHNEQEIAIATSMPLTVFVNANGTNYPNEWIEYAKSA